MSVKKTQRKVAMQADKREMPRKRTIRSRLKYWMISDIVTIEPLRALPITNRETKLRTMLTVPIPPTRTRKPLSPRRLQNWEPIIAAWVGPRAGRKEHKLEEKTEDNKACQKHFFEIVIVLCFCFGILVFSVILTSNIEVPNKPESMGNKGSSRLRMFKTNIPKQPANKNKHRAQNLPFLSRQIRKREEKISMKTIKGLIKG